MSLIKTDGTYVKVNKEWVRQNLSNPSLLIYKNQEVRQNPTEWDMVRGESRQTEVTDEQVNALVTEMYIGLKALPEFEGAIDA